MGTTCEVHRVKDGFVDQIHFSYDGYLTGVGLKLFRHYNTPDSVDRLFSRDTSAPSLEADPDDMLWENWMGAKSSEEDPMRGKPVETFMAEAMLDRERYGSYPHNPQNVRRLIEAISATGLVGHIQERSRTSDLPPQVRAMLPSIITKVFGGARMPNIEHNTLLGIADQAACPLDHDFDTDEDYGLFYVWAHDRWCYPHTVRELREFLATGESPNIITREYLLENGASESSLVVSPSPPVDQMEGVFSFNGVEAFLVTGSERWLLAAGPQTTISGSIDDYQNKLVRVRTTSMAVQSASRETTKRVAIIRSMEIVGDAPPPPPKELSTISSGLQNWIRGMGRTMTVSQLSAKFQFDEPTIEQILAAPACPPPLFGKANA